MRRVNVHFIGSENESESHGRNLDLNHIILFDGIACSRLLYSSRFRL